MYTVNFTSSGKRHSITIDDSFLLSIGEPITGPNKETVSLFLASWFALLADSPLQKVSRPWTSFRKMKKLLRDNGLKGTIVLLSNIAHKLVSESYYLDEPGTSISAFVDDPIVHEMAKTPVFKEFWYILMRTPNELRALEKDDIAKIESVTSWLYTFLNFGKKLDYADPEFDKAAFRSWLDVESSLESIRFEESELSFLDSFSQLYSHLFVSTILDQSLVLDACKSEESLVVSIKLEPYHTTHGLISSSLEAFLESLASEGSLVFGWTRYYLIRPDGSLRVVYRLGSLD